MDEVKRPAKGQAQTRQTARDQPREKPQGKGAADKEGNMKERVMLAAADEIALFRSGHEALRFAYAYNAQQYPMTIMGRMMRGRLIGSGRGLHGLDGAAEAGNVKRVVQSLPHDYRHALICRYTLSDREFAESANALLKPVIASFGTGTHYTRMALKLICRYFGRADHKLATLCDEFRMDAATMTRRWQRCRDRLKAVESAAENAADDALVEAGLVMSMKRG